MRRVVSSGLRAIGAILLFAAPVKGLAGTPLYFCASQEDNSSFDSIMISTGKGPYIFEGTFRYINKDGAFIEKTLNIFRTQKSTDEGLMIHFYASGIQIRLFPTKKLGDESFAAKLSVPEIGLEFSSAACKPLTP